MVRITLKEELLASFHYFLAREKINKLRKNFNSKFSKTYKLSKGKKLFCILEQGASKDDPFVSQQKKLFSTDFCDFFRLNWMGNKNDSLANFFKKDITWSEGRSFLFDKLKGKYHFYIFLDDDISIDSLNEKNPALLIKDELTKFQPIHASIINNTWPNIRFNDLQNIISMKGGDLCVQIFRSDFAECMFPTWLHGSGKSMWYAQFIAHILYPKGSIYLNSLIASNLRTESHEDQNLSSYNKPDSVCEFFKNKIKEKKIQSLFKLWFEYSNSKIIRNKIYRSESIKVCPLFEKEALFILLKNI